MNHGRSIKSNRPMTHKQLVCLFSGKFDVICQSHSVMIAGCLNKGSSEITYLVRV